ncbi:hypothetical protein [Sphingorhabdus sp. Alg239-R122]|uniref:hypothetical protein n=1 Tax=Sphingorhabdus sp. Alg239-R122 TaxID=2305989 RepID=UPI0013DC67E3|nr:hypothetical protein [Sphingorhabdus sp. Alg239-R122]
MDKARKILLAALFGASLAVAACSDSANAQRGDPTEEQTIGLSNEDSNVDLLAHQNRELEVRVGTLEEQAKTVRDASMPIGDLLLWLIAMTGLAAGIFAMLRLRAIRAEIDGLKARLQKRSGSSSVENELNMLKGQVSNMSADYREFKDSVSGKLAAGGGAAVPPQLPASKDVIGEKYVAVDTSKAPHQAKTVAAPAQPPPPPDDSAFLQKMATAFNAIESPEDIAAFETEFAPQAFTNDRNSGVANIFEDRRARFWLVKSPTQQGKAYLIPGSDAKRNWLKFKDKVPDHPFEHHFAFSAGGSLRLVKPAIVAEGGEGWELRTLGQIEGVQ